MSKQNLEQDFLEIGQRILDETDAFIYGIRYDTRELVYGNRAAKKRFADFKAGKLCYKVLHGRSEPCVQCPMSRIRQGEPSVSISAYMSNTKQWLQVIFNDSVMKDGEHVCLCTGSDITGLKESELMTESVLNGIRAAAYTIGADDYRILSTNTYLRNLLPEIKEGDLCYKALWNRDSVCDHCPVPHFTPEKTQDSMMVYNEKLAKHLSIDSVRVLDGNNKPVVIFTGYDISNQVEAEQHLKKIAYEDLLLHIKNRFCFMNDLSQNFKEDTPFTVCISRLKNFADYNLAFGKEAGDSLLQELAEYYKFNYTGDVYRVGGSKFAYIAKTEDDLQSLNKIIYNPIPEKVINKNKSFRFYIDHVLIEAPQYAMSPELVIHNAEYMLKKSKKMDSSETMYFRNGEQVELERKNKLVDIVHQKIEENGLQVYYQPIYSIEKEAFTKCEALVRLWDEELGFVSPNEFIPIVEESGLINQLGIYVLDEACKQIVWRAQQGLPPVQFHVNVSTIQFSTDGFYDAVIETINQYDFDRRLLQLEVTESILINSFEYIVEIMRQLIEQGINFAVDDFGTGYSSLSYIGTLPIVEIKLDKAFIDHIAQSDVYVLIIKNVIEIAKGLHFKIVAEGVESYGQYQLLKKLGCDYIQGFLFSKPLPTEVFHQFLEQHYQFNDSDISYTDTFK